MKVIFMLALLTLSNLSVAADQANKAEVIDAIKTSLAEKDLSCVRDGKKAARASEMDYSYLSEKYYKMTIDEGSQPAIKFSNVSSDIEYRTEVFTNEDLTVVIELRFIAISTERKRVNVGTIVKPKFETIVSKSITGQIICK